MRFLLDSNIIIFVAEGENELVRQRLGCVEEGDVVTSSIAYAEVVHGSARGKSPRIKKLEKFVSKVPVLPFDDKAARAYASIPFKRASYDRLIAAHALSLDLVLVTDNLKHFADVPGLKVENWAA